MLTTTQRPTPGFLLATVALALALAAPAAANPVINDNFVARVTVEADRSTVLQLLDQSSTVTLVAGSESVHIFSWFSGHEERFDFTTPNQTVLEVPAIAAAGFFDDVALMRQDGTCSANGKSGQVWYNDQASGPFSYLELCANGNTPIYRKWTLPAQGVVQMYFLTFTPGVPAPNNFVPEPATFPLLALALAAAATLGRKRL